MYFSFSFFLFIIPFILKGPILLLSLGSLLTPLPGVCVCERSQPCGAGQGRAAGILLSSVLVAECKAYNSAETVILVA